MRTDFITPQTPEWYSARSGKFTASGFGKLMTDTKKGGWTIPALNYIYEKAREKFSGGNVKTLMTKPMRWGSRMESPAMKALERYLDKTVHECGFVTHPQITEAGATPDGLILDDDGYETALVEIKCPYNPKVHLNYYNRIKTGANLKGIKPQYYWQVQGELWVMGLDLGYFVSFDPRRLDEKRLHVVEISRDEKDIAKLEKTVIKAIAARNERMKSF